MPTRFHGNNTKLRKPARSHASMADKYNEGSDIKLFLLAWSEVVACSGSLSSLSLKRRGNRMLMPRSGSSFPIAALCTGDFDRSAHFTSQT